MSVPAWKKAIFERRRQQEEEEKRKKAEKDAYLASLPPWKRAMVIKKMGETSNTTSTSQQSSKESLLIKRRENTPNKTSSLQPRPFPIVETRPEPTVPSWRKALEERKTVAEARMRLEKSQIETTDVNKNNKEESVGPKRSSGMWTQTAGIEQTDGPESNVVSKVESLTKQQETEKEQRYIRPKLVKGSSLLQSMDADDPQFMSMPKWKQDLIKRKRQSKLQQQSSFPAVVSNSNEKVSSKQQITVVSKSNEIQMTVAPEIQITANLKEDFNVKPEIVNASNKKEDDSPKLVKREGKSLKPPVYKVTSKWAEITEDNPEFQNLPQWKQALIRRRKNDVTKRTTPPEPLKSVEKNTKEESSVPIATLWSPTHSVIKHSDDSDKTSEENETVSLWRKQLKKRPENKKIIQDVQQPAPVVNSSVGGSKIQALLGRFSGDVLNRSPSPVEDMEVTMIDEESEDDEPIQPLTPTGNSIPNRKLRRVSWSDSKVNETLCVEYVYPKYDYSDYESLTQDDDTDSNELATPVHPWLSSMPTSPPPLPEPKPNIHSYMSSNVGSVGSFMSAYTGSMASSNSSNTSSKKNITEENYTQTDIYSNLNSDTAALIW